MFRSLHIDYKTTRTELCQIGAKYDTDKSSQRENASDSNHCHPYTCFYHSLFRHSRTKPLQICELGVLRGASLKMWRDYFQDVEITAFDNNLDFVYQFQQTEFEHVPLHVLPHLRPVSFSYIDVTSRENISSQFASIGRTYDLIIEDTTHQMDDQINVIMETTKYLKPGGMMIVEDVFLRYDENEYRTRLQPIVEEFADIYFVTLDHKNRISTGWDNDKLMIMVKKGAPPIFKNEKKLTLITPCSRPENVMKIHSSINFDYVDKWYIVYDEKRIPVNPLFFNGENPQIVETMCAAPGISGNPQRNHALNILQNHLTNSYVYFLDDDTAVHPSLYHLLDVVDDNRIYTFNMMLEGKVVAGTNPTVNSIDTSQLLIDMSLLYNIRWIPHVYNADGYFAQLCVYLNPDKWVYVNNTISNYNALSHSIFRGLV
jgi:predicted O-methyltransferase YrrM